MEAEQHLIRASQTRLDIAESAAKVNAEKAYRLKCGMGLAAVGIVLLLAAVVVALWTEPTAATPSATPSPSATPQAPSASDTDTSNLVTLIATVVVALGAVGGLLMNGRAGFHARRSAEASERAADASRDAAAATIAAVPVDFAIGPIVAPDIGFIRIEAQKASVWVHEVRLTSVWEGGNFARRDDICPFVSNGPPAFVHAGNAVVCGWPPPLPTTDFEARLKVTYSFAQDGPRLTAERKAKGDVIHPGETTPEGG